MGGQSLLSGTGMSAIAHFGVGLIEQRGAGKAQPLDPGFGIRLRKVETFLCGVTNQQVLCWCG